MNDKIVINAKNIIKKSFKYKKNITIKKTKKERAIMLKISKSEIKNFLKTPSSGAITSATHKIVYGAMAEDHELKNMYNQAYSIPSDDIKNRFSIDSENEKYLIYMPLRVKEISTSNYTDITIGFDGIDFSFFINEDIQLLSKNIKKNENTIYSSFAEIYEENNQIPKELKYLTSNVKIIDSLLEYEKNLNQLLNDSKSIKNNKNETKEKINKNEKKSTKSVDSNQNNTTSIHKVKENDLGFQNQTVMMQVETPKVEIDPIQLQKINDFKRSLGLKILKSKEENAKINFRNIKYPKPTNALEEAIFLNGGTKPILCYGRQGSGKSFTAEAFAKKLEKELGIPIAFYDILLEKNLDKADIVGSPVLKDDAFNYQKMAEAFMSARDGHLTIFLVDEIFRLKEMGTFFNLFGKTHYKLDTGRQLEVVELITEDLNGELQTTHYCLSDRKVLNPNVVIDNAKIQYLKSSDDISFKQMPEQKIKDRLALGEIPTIERKDYLKYNLDALKVSSFYTSEQIKAPIEKLIIIAAGNIGNEFQAHFHLDTDKAFKSRWAICELPAPTLKDYIKVFENTLVEAHQNGYVRWDSTKVNIEHAIKTTTQSVKTIFEQIFKMSTQRKSNKDNSSIESNISHRNFVELADNLCKQTEINSNTIKKCFKAQEKAILPHIEDANSRRATKEDVQLYTQIIDIALGIKQQESPLVQENNNTENQDISNARTL